MEMVLIETTKPMNLQTPPEGIPFGYTPAGMRFLVPKYTADRLIAAGEGKPVEPEAIQEAVGDTQGENHEGTVDRFTASGRLRRR